MLHDLHHAELVAFNFAVWYSSLLRSVTTHVTVHKRHWEGNNQKVLASIGTYFWLGGIESFPPSGWDVLGKELEVVKAVETKGNTEDRNGVVSCKTVVLKLGSGLGLGLEVGLGSGDGPWLAKVSRWAPCWSMLSPATLSSPPPSPLLLLAVTSLGFPACKGRTFPDCEELGFPDCVAATFPVSLAEFWADCCCDVLKGTGLPRLRHSQWEGTSWATRLTPVPGVHTSDQCARVICQHRDPPPPQGLFSFLKQVKIQSSDFVLKCSCP